MKKLTLTIESQNLSTYGWEDNASYDLTLINCTFTKDNLPPNIHNLHLICCERTFIDINITSTFTVEGYNIMNFAAFKGLKVEKMNVINCNIHSFDLLSEMNIKHITLDNTVNIYSSEVVEILPHTTITATKQHAKSFVSKNNIEIVESVIHF